MKIVCGPARSGKTQRLLAKYRDALRTASPGTVLWLTPTHLSVAAVQRRLLGTDLAACLAPGVMTFGQLAERILESSPEIERPIGLLVQRRLLGEIVTEEVERGALQYFRYVASTPGLIDQLTEFIRELKRLEIWPEHFRQACESRGATAKDADLATIYEEYQRRLVEGRLYDAEGRFWSARNLLRDDRQAAIGQLQLLIVDGFTDFTHTQHDMLADLAGRADAVYVTLPLESPPARKELFAKCHQTLKRLLSRHAGAERIDVDRTDDPAWPAMARLERSLFCNPREQQGVGPTDGIEIISAPRPRGEIEAVARRVKKLLVEGDPVRNGDRVGPDEIAIVFRSLETAASSVREVFDRHGIPVVVASTEPLSSHALAKALLAVIELVVEDWPLRRLLAVLTHSAFHPSWTALRDATITSRAERVLRELQIAGGRDSILRALEVRSATDAVPRSPASETFALLSRLGKSLDRLPEVATLSEWIVAIEELANDLGWFSDVGLADGDAADRRGDWPIVWQRIKEILSADRQLSRWLERPEESLDLTQLHARLIDVLRTEPVPSSKSEVGRVRVLSAIGARNLSVPYLFVAGLTERSFPLKRRTTIYSEHEYQRLAEANLPVVLHAEQSQQEMLLFYETVTRAGRRLVLSYPSLNDKLEPELPSPYLLSACRACGMELPVEKPELSPIPTDDEVASVGTWRIKATLDALDGRPARLAGMLTQPESAGVARNILAALEAIASRASRSEFGSFEGLVTSDRAKHRLSALFGDDRHWSPSELELYAACPFRFFAERVLRLKPMEAMELATDVAGRGSIVHETLAQVHRKLPSPTPADDPSPTLGDRESFVREFEQVLTELIADLSRQEPLTDALAEIDRLRLVRLADDYYEQHAQYDMRPDGEKVSSKKGAAKQPAVRMRPAHFEVSFGHSDKSDDPLSRPEPLELRYGEMWIRMAGRIDRIDRGALGETTLLNVIDYKSGSAPKTAGKPDAPQVEGTAIQLFIYSLAVTELLLADEETMTWNAGYWSLKEKAGFRSIARYADVGVDEARPIDRRDDLKQDTIRQVAEIVFNARAGNFPVSSADKDCTRYCPFKTICRIGQVRQLEKRWTAAAPPR